jgi:signal transduction histidine kinase
MANNKADVVLSKGLAYSLCVDKDNVVWVDADTTGNGLQEDLYRLDRNRNQLISFLEPGSQKRISYVSDILEDNIGELWITARHAIYKISKNRDLVRKYDENNGVHQNYYQNSDNYTAMDGKLYIGDEAGYYSFYPDDLKDDPPPILNITSFKLNGKEVVPGESEILKMPVWQTKEIHLLYNQNNFSFDFIGIDYQTEGVVNYLYKLENYDGDWHKYGSEHQAFYYNLLPGKYIFHVRASNDEGGSVEKVLSIFISPPWWKTWWAYTIFALLFAGGIWRFIDYRSKKLRNENRQLEEKITQRTIELTHSLEKLKSTQSQLVQSEKMASLGELTAGIAHEIQNPLNFVNNFSEVNSELIEELEEEADKGHLAEVKLIAKNIKENEQKINHHGKRADSIVKGMLQHSRTSAGKKELTDINALADEYLRLAYHGLRAKDKNFNAAMKTNFDQTIGAINIIPQDIGRVLLNLYNNAFYAAYEKKKLYPDGFEPTVSMSTRKVGNKIEIRVRDNGNGIPQKVIDKIFQPFFTTKPTGQGTGLGLSLSYDIVKAHGGDIKVDTKEGEFTEFTINLPV